MRAVLVFEASILCLLGIVAWAFASVRDVAVYVACIFFIFFILHLALVLYKGLDLVVYDEDPQSPVKIYWFAAIFVATFGAGFLRDAILA